MAATLSSDSGDQGHDLRLPQPPPEKLCIDDMLTKYCGEFGRWHLRQFILASLAWPLEAFHSMVIIFADNQPSWRCLPGAAGSGCHATAASVCNLKPGSWEWVGGHSSSTVAEWGLICGDKYKVGLVHSLFFVGCMIGAGIFGHLSDSFLGRKGSLIVACILSSIFGCLTALSPKYWIYVLLRILTGITTGGIGINAFALETEPVGPTKRGVAGMSAFYFFSSGIAVLSATAYLFPKWRHLYIASSIPSILFVVLILIPFVSESPRWYLIRGKVSKATKLMSTIASTNGKHLPSDVILALDQDTTSSSTPNNESINDDQTNKKQSSENTDAMEGHSKNQTNEKEPSKNKDAVEGHSVDDDQSSKKNEGSENKEAIEGSIVDIIRSPVTRIRLILAITLNFLVCVVYYGLTLNVVNLGTNLYLNTALNSVAELPAFAITAALLNKLGRKQLTIGTMWFSGLFSLAGSLMRKHGAWKVVRMVCGILGIFGMAGTYNLLFIYTAELFPTVVRNVALGCAAQASQSGAILAPIVVVLGGWLPFAIFAACGIVGGLFVFYLPETLNQPLYDTFIGLEAATVNPKKEAATV